MIIRQYLHAYQCCTLRCEDFCFAVKHDDCRIELLLNCRLPQFHIFNIRRMLFSRIQHGDRYQILIDTFKNQ